MYQSASIFVTLHTYAADALQNIHFVEDRDADQPPTKASKPEKPTRRCQRNNDVCGIARDLFPAVQPSRQTSFTTTTTTDDSDAEDQDIIMRDFVAIDNSDSESEDVDV